MLSNLSVIALSFVVIVTGVALLPVSLIPFVSKCLSWLLTMEIRIMNSIIQFVERLPHAVTENIDYHIVQVILLYGVIGCFCYLLHQRSRKVFWLMCGLFVSFCSSFSVRKLRMDRETEFLTYHIRKCSAVSFAFAGHDI